MRFFLISLILIFATGCEDQKRPLPSLPDEEFVKILADIHLAEIAAKKVHSSKKDSFMNIYSEQVFQIHHITKEEFNSQFEILKNNPEKLSDIYDETLNYLNAMNQKE